MATIDHIESAAARPAGKDPPAATVQEWGNAAPLALAAFAVTTFMLSMINAGFVDKAIEPVVFGVALMFGGLTQLLAGLIILRTGNTFAGVLFCGFGAFWLSLFAVAEFFLKAVPPAQVGHALGLFIFAFGIFIVWLFAASFRTNVVVVVALADLVAVFAVLGAGNYNGTAGLIKTGGWLGLVAAALAAYLSCAELCQATYGREVLPIGHLAKK